MANTKPEEAAAPIEKRDWHAPEFFLSDIRHTDKALFSTDSLASPHS